MNIESIMKESGGHGIKKHVRPDKICSVYFLCEPDGEIVYIGSTVDIVHRMDHHEKKFNGCLVYYFDVHEKCRTKVERTLICRIKPRMNVWWKMKPRVMELTKGRRLLK